MKQGRLNSRAREFANELSGLLNRTICHGIRITAVTEAGRNVAQIGYNIKADDLVTQAIPLGTSKAEPRAYLLVSYTLMEDDDPRYMRVETSVLGVSLDSGLNDLLFHYDYERNKVDGYPEAHVQIPMRHEHWDTLKERCGQSQSFGQLHLPVGNRRYRPTLEDVVEFLIVEGISPGATGWEDAILEGRTGFERRQLRAAIRRNPDAAREMLDEL